MKAEALKYITGEGKCPPLSIIPLKGKIPLCPHGSKDATKDRAQVESWWTKYPEANIGIVTGKDNGLLVIDVDQKPDQGKYGAESLRDLEKELGNLPETWTALTGSGGYHYFFKYPEGHDIRNSASQLAPDLDVRAQGGYVVAPPSVHPETGREYCWEYDPVETELAELPDAWLQRLIQKKETTNKTFTLPERIAKGARNEVLFKYGASLRATATPALRILSLLQAVNGSRCDPPLKDAEIKLIFESVLKYPSGSPESEIMNSRNHEIKNTEEDLSQFHHFDGHGRATGVYDFRIFEYLRETTDLFVVGGVPYHYVDGVYHPDPSGATLKTMIRKKIYPELIKSTTIDRVYRLFLSEAEIQLQTEELNQYPQHWINFRNGFYDPVRKVLIPHDPKYKAVNQIPHEYHPEAVITGKEVDQWLQFIAPEPDDREMLLQFFGYCLTRDTRQQKFLILYGAGGSGKSTLIRLLETMIGSENISNISLKELGQRFASYGLLGKLLNSCADLESSALEDVSTLKKALGEDALRAEAKGKDSISFKSYAKMIFSTNQLPLILSESTNGFYRRLLILKMSRQPEQKRSDYVEVLQTETEYLIQLSVKALERMYQTGLICESIGSQEAVQALRCDSDTVEAWIVDSCVRDRSSRIERGILYQKYEVYCLSTDRTPLRKNSFYRTLRMKDFPEVKSMGQRYFEGISFEKTALKNCPTFYPVDDQLKLPEEWGA